MHVHGLGVNSADGLVYAATHFGLWQLPEGGRAERVGDAAYDLMGFTVVGEDHFRASGHPPDLEDLPPLLGLIETTDGGQSWRSLSFLGAVDFHALRVAHEQVYGWDLTSGAFMVSDDGEAWDRRSWEDLDTPPIARLTWETPERLWGVGIDGSVWRSSDGGREWEQAGGRVGGRPEAFLDAGDSLLVAAGGAILESTDGGETWEVRHRSEERL